MMHPFLMYCKIYPLHYHLVEDLPFEEANENVNNCQIDKFELIVL